MWKNKTVSVVFPAYNEEENIHAAIRDFSQEYVDEIIVVDNNSTDKTREEAAKTNARIISETRQGYGFALRKGLSEAKGDYIIMAEPDGTFSGMDMIKLLTYAEEVDMVQGSRTNRSFIWSGANMGFLIKWGNWAVGKAIEVLFNGTCLSDVGCTMRLIKKEALKKIDGQFTVGREIFLPEMTMLLVLNGLTYVELPLNYRKRIGQSKSTGKSLWIAAWVGLKMCALILKYRLTRKKTKSMVNSQL